MKKVKYLLLLLSLSTLIFFSSCRKEAFPDDSFSDPDTSQGEGSTEHPFSDGETLLTLYQVNGDQLSKLVDYEVSGRYLSLQQDYALHLQMWEYFTRLIPIADREKITEFLVFEGNNDLQGFVEPIREDDLSRWKMGLAIDAIGNLEEINLADFFAAVTIHEYGHVLTLNDEQVDVGGSENSCSQFFTGEGCAQSDAYINELYNIGWADIYDEFLGTKEQHINTRFYDKYRDRFVSDYAATNPGEDIAEVFTHFVVEAKPPSGNSIADQKIKAMYAHPELVQLRASIRQNPAVRALRLKDRPSPKCRHKKQHRVYFSTDQTR